MIGIIFAAISTGRAIADGVKKGCESARGYQRGIERRESGADKTNTYFDYDGTRRDLDTDEIRNVDPILVESNGRDQCVRNMYGNVIRNLSQERRMEAFKKAKKRGNRTVVMHRQFGNSPTNRDLGGDGYCEGTQFKDLTTREIYVARMFKVRDLKKGEEMDAGYVPFYMNLKGLLVREADSVTKKRKNGVRVPSEKEIEDFIKTFNHKQMYENGWYDCKDEMFFVDSFGKRASRDTYMTGLYYCNKDQVFNDV